MVYQSLLIATATIDTLCDMESIKSSGADHVYLAFLELRIDASQSASCLEGSATSGAWLGCDVAHSSPLHSRSLKAGSLPHSLLLLMPETCL